ncbi:MAG: hypothetical protein MZV64_12645 [Ignavibacteriales bacterium]|nr:hypothetical protein [Ignavibacteriales bacterium]
MVEEEQDVLGPLPQRRQVDGDDRSAGSRGPRGSGPARPRGRGPGSWR